MGLKIVKLLVNILLIIPNLVLVLAWFAFLVIVLVVGAAVFACFSPIAIVIPEIGKPLATPALWALSNLENFSNNMPWIWLW